MNEQVGMIEKENNEKYKLVSIYLLDLAMDEDLDHLELRAARRIAEYMADASIEGLNKGINQTMAKFALQKEMKPLTADQQFEQIKAQNIQEEMEEKIKSMDKPVT